jgi:hypothetical protein
MPRTQSLDAIKYLIRGELSRRPGQNASLQRRLRISGRMVSGKTAKVEEMSVDSR